MNAGSQEEAFSPIVGRARARLTTGVVLMTLALIGATLTVGASPAQAKTYKRLATKSVKAYDSDGYKYRIKASGFGRVPSGYINVANSVTVKRNGRTVAKNKASYRAKAGTYTVYYKSKIRKRVSTRVPVIVTAEIQAKECTVTNSTVTRVPSRVDDGFGNISYTGTFSVTYTSACVGLYYKDYGDQCDAECVADYLDYMGYYLGEYVREWDTSLPGSNFTSQSEWEATRLANGTVESWVCDDNGYPAANDPYGCTGYAGPRNDYQYVWYRDGFRYGPVVTRYFKRTVKVVKKNTRYITPSEWKKLRSGLSVGEVSRLFGNAGKVSYVSGNLVSRAYRDITWTGSYCKTYYLTFKNGRLYSWDNDQFTNTCGI
jgi:hypothetical protein